MKTYYACLQDNTLLEHVWLSIPAEDSDKAFDIAYTFYRKECDRNNYDCLAICIMEEPLNAYEE